MAASDDIDRLYQLPLSEFTAARNALLKAAAPGTQKAEVRGLQKPSAPAWAVNQLYWRDRKTYAALIGAGERLRASQLQQLSGKRADVAAAESAHREALKDAMTSIRHLLESSGEAASPSTMAAVSETLQSLPGDERPGRLTRPLKPRGFEALAGLVPGAGATIARMADVRPVEPPAPSPSRKARASEASRDAAAQKHEAAAARRAAEARRREIAGIEKDLRDARAAEREATAALSRTEMLLARARRERKELEARLDQITADRDRLATELEQHKRASERASAERTRLEDKLDALRR